MPRIFDVSGSLRILWLAVCVCVWVICFRRVGEEPEGKGWNVWFDSGFLDSDRTIKIIVKSSSLLYCCFFIRREETTTEGLVALIGEKIDPLIFLIQDMRFWITVVSPSFLAELFLGLGDSDHEGGGERGEKESTAEIKIKPQRVKDAWELVVQRNNTIPLHVNNRLCSQWYELSPSHQYSTAKVQPVLGKV